MHSEDCLYITEKKMKIKNEIKKLAFKGTSIHLTTSDVENFTFFTLHYLIQN